MCRALSIYRGHFASITHETHPKARSKGEARGAVLECKPDRSVIVETTVLRAPSCHI